MYGIQKRRSNITFSPPMILNLYTWHDASDSSTITLNGSNVTLWQDKSDNNINFSQATAANQPLYTQQLNGKNVITFDGINDYLRGTSFSISQPATMFFVIKEDADPGENLNRFFDTQVANRWSFYYDGRTGINQYRIGTNLIIGYTESPANLQPHVYTLTYNGTNSSILREGVQKVAGNTGTTTSAIDIYVGSSSTPANFLNGKMAEIITYSRNLTNSEEDIVLNYLRNKWGI